MRVSASISRWICCATSRPRSATAASSGGLTRESRLHVLCAGEVVVQLDDVVHAHHQHEQVLRPGRIGGELRIDLRRDVGGLGAGRAARDAARGQVVRIAAIERHAEARHQRLGPDRRAAAVDHVALAGAVDAVALAVGGEHRGLVTQQDDLARLRTARSGWCRRRRRPTTPRRRTAPAHRVAPDSMPYRSTCAVSNPNARLQRDAARCRRSRTPSQGAVSGGCSTQISCTPCGVELAQHGEQLVRRGPRRRRACAGARSADRHARRRRAGIYRQLCTRRRAEHAERRLQHLRCASGAASRAARSALPACRTRAARRAIGVEQRPAQRRASILARDQRAGRSSTGSAARCSRRSSTRCRPRRRRRRAPAGRRRTRRARARAVVGLTRPKRFALGAASPARRRSAPRSEQRMRDRMRRAAQADVAWPPAAAAATPGARGTITVSGPGQNASHQPLGASGGSVRGEALGAGARRPRARSADGRPAGPWRRRSAPRRASSSARAPRP